MRTRFLPLLAIFAAGCESEPVPPAAPPPPAPEIGAAFNPATCGSVTGRVTWNGPIPSVPEFPNHVGRADGTYSFQTAPNPYRPQINPASLGVAGVVVSLQGIDPHAARPWDQPPVAVEIGNGKIEVTQGDRRGRVGFVRPGDSVTVSSNEERYHVLRGRGDAFFSLTLPEPNKPVTRTLTTRGRVELSSGSGLYWVRGDLFVVDHPYYTVTAPGGKFTFDRVPAGPVKLVVWHPGWEAARMERDPDSTAVARMVYSPPIERTTAVTVAAGAETKAQVTLP